MRSADIIVTKVAKNGVGRWGWPRLYKKTVLYYGNEWSRQTPKRLRYCSHQGLSSLQSDYWLRPNIDRVSPAVCSGSCAKNRLAMNLTSERGLIELGLTSSMSRSSSKSTLQFECQWLIVPSSGHTSVVLQFLGLRLFAAAASGRSSPAKTKSAACSESFVEVRVGKNLVSHLVFLQCYVSFSVSIGLVADGKVIRPVKCFAPAARQRAPQRPYKIG